MKTTEDNFISDAHFDVLLRHALLGKEKMFNEQTLETMAKNILAADYADSTDSVSASKEQTIVEKLVSDFKSGGSKFRLNIFLLLFFTVATIVTVIFFTSKKRNFTSQNNQYEVVTKDNPTTESNNPVISIQEVTANPLPRKNPVLAAFFDSIQTDETFPVQINNGQPVFSDPMHIPLDISYAYEDVPTLNEDQKKQTAKDKLKIMKEVGKKRVYSTLPHGATNVNGVLTQVKGFGIKDAEITNFEYRTFLNDLLVKGNFEDYLLAKPVAGGWKTVGIAEFENVYFENIKYNDFPAANMTRKGAELFCNWMTSSMKDAITKKEIKWSGSAMPDFRLPSNVEWIYAARGCDTTIQYPWEKYPHTETQNARGCYLCNFNYSVSKEKLGTEGPLMEKNNTKGCLSATMSKRTVITTAGRAIDTLLTCPVYSYNPNTKGVYNTLGDVSEMVWTYDVANPTVQGAARSMGGSWYSHVDNVLIEAPEQYVGVTEACAYIGFRIVMIMK